MNTRTVMLAGAAVAVIIFFVSAIAFGVVKLTVHIPPSPETPAPYVPKNINDMVCVPAQLKETNEALQTWAAGKQLPVEQFVVMQCYTI